MSTISKFAVSAAGMATWENPGKPTAALYIVDTRSKHGAKMSATAVRYQFPAGSFHGGDDVDLVRAGGSVFTAKIPAVAPVNTAMPTITFAQGGVDD